jgi:hypothetical protein
MAVAQTDFSGHWEGCSQRSYPWAARSGSTATDLPGSPTFELTLADGKLKGALRPASGKRPGPAPLPLNLKKN